MTDPQPSGAAVRSKAEVETAHARRYLAQLCKHFGHKCPTSHDEHAGQITFEMGVCSLQAGAERLTLSLDAPDGLRLERLQDVVARHLVRFAFREDMQVCRQAQR
jgi:hypothetical protein